MLFCRAFADYSHVTARGNCHVVTRMRNLYRHASAIKGITDCRHFTGE